MGPTAVVLETAGKIALGRGFHSALAGLKLRAVALAAESLSFVSVRFVGSWPLG